MAIAGLLPRLLRKIPVDLPGFHLRDVQYIVDQPGEPLPLAHEDIEIAPDLLDRPLLLLRLDLGRWQNDLFQPLLDDPCEAEDGGEGSPEFVGDGRGEVHLHLADFVLPADVPEHEDLALELFFFPEFCQGAGVSPAALFRLRLGLVDRRSAPQ